MTRYPHINIKHQDEVITIVVLDEDLQGYELVFRIATEQFEEAYSVDASGPKAFFEVVSMASVDIGLTIQCKRIISTVYPNYEL